MVCNNFAIAFYFLQLQYILPFISTKFSNQQFYQLCCCCFANEKQLLLSLTAASTTVVY